MQFLSQCRTQQSLGLTIQLMSEFVTELKLNRVEWLVITSLVLWVEAGIKPTTFGL